MISDKRQKSILCCILHTLVSNNSVFLSNSLYAVSGAISPKMRKYSLFQKVAQRTCMHHFILLHCINSRFEITWHWIIVKIKSWINFEITHQPWKRTWTMFAHRRHKHDYSINSKKTHERYFVNHKLFISLIQIWGIWMKTTSPKMKGNCLEIS